MKELLGTLLQLPDDVGVEAAPPGLVVQEHSLRVLPLHVEQRVLHLGKRVAVALVDLVAGVEEAAEVAAGDAHDLLVAEGVDVADKVASEQLHVELGVAGAAEHHQALDDLLEKRVRVDFPGQDGVRFNADELLDLLPGACAVLGYDGALEGKDILFRKLVDSFFIFNWHLIRGENFSQESSF